jgi:hypothetical protein
MNRLATIAARRHALVRETQATRQSVRATVGRARVWVAPISIALAAGQAVAGRGWVRAAALASVAMLLLRRWRA